MKFARRGKDGTILGPETKPSDPAYRLLLDGHTTTPKFNRSGCYICQDPEFSQMGLPLCYACKFCGGHVPADDTVCWDCDRDAMEDDA